MTGEKYPVKEANRISKILDTTLPPDLRFPVDVAKVALELTPCFNQDPITQIKSLDFNFDKDVPIDGMLRKHENKKYWFIGVAFLNGNHGRLNFTLGHELGHYMLHRHLLDEFLCGKNDILSGVDKQKEIEREANIFAGNLLMPNNSFRTQIEREKFSFDLIHHCANFYGVSLTAATLKWIELTTKRAVVVLSSDGFMHWSISSSRALKSNIFYSAKKNTIEVPQQSIVASENFDSQRKNRAKYKANVWFNNLPDDEEVEEHSMYLGEYGEVISVLVFDDAAWSVDLADDEERLSELSLKHT